MLFLRFYDDSDKVKYSKKEVLLKAIGFYIFYQIAVSISISIIFLCDFKIYPFNSEKNKK